MRTTCILGAAAALLTACTTVDQTRLPDGRSVYKIACGAAAPWEICRDQATDVCPTGYQTLSMNAGFNRKEMTILCPQTGALVSAD
jgi:hypothetical protein